MNVNKKLDRFRQWGKEKMGGGGDKTDTNEDFKGLEAEMNLRQEGKLFWLLFPPPSTLLD